MSEDFEIKNKVAESGLVNFDLSELSPKGKRMGIDLKDFLFMEIILKEKDFREKVAAIDAEDYRDAYVYIFCSADAIIPIWAYFLITSKLSGTAKKVVYGTRKDLETLLMHEAIAHYNFEKLKDKKVLVKGCSEEDIPENAYVELVEKLKPLVKSLMFGEACSNVPIFKS